MMNIDHSSSYMRSVQLGLSEELPEYFIEPPRLKSPKENTPSTSGSTTSNSSSNNSSNNSPYHSMEGAITSAYKDAETMEYTGLSPVNNGADSGVANHPYGAIQNKPIPIPTFNTYFDHYYYQNPTYAGNYIPQSYDMNPRYQAFEHAEVQMMNQENQENSDDEFVNPGYTFDNYQTMKPVKVERKPMKDVSYNENLYQQGTSMESVEYTYPSITIEEANKMLDAPLPDDQSSVDTKQVAFGIKKWQNRTGKSRVNQTAFAQNVLERTQGTLSGLLSNPKNWDDMNRGRATFLRMYNWLKMTEDQRQAILDVKSQEVKVPKSDKKKNVQEEKSARVIFTCDQKNALNDVFRQNRHPSRMEVEGLARSLKLEYKTANNFFMNARRRSRK